MSMPAVTVVIPARDEAADLGRCLAAVAAQDLPLDQVEVVVVDGGSRDETAAVAKRALDGVGFARVEVVDNPAGTTPSNLNAGLGAATGRVLCRVDARSVIPPDYLRRCVGLLDARPDVAVVGGAQVALARDDSATAVGIARALNNRYGMGLARYRSGAGSGPTDTVYLGAFRTDELRGAGGWDDAFPTNQDYELNRRMGRRGIVWFEAALDVGYLPRSTVGELFGQYRRFGRWKVRYWRSTGDRPRPRQLVLLGAPMVGGAAALAVVASCARPRRRAAALGVGAATALAAVDQLGARSDAAGTVPARLRAVTASVAIAGGWSWGVWSALLGRRGPVPSRSDRVVPLDRTGPPGTAPRVAYVVSRWGEPTQTFVRREAASVAAHDVEVEAWSLQQPREVVDAQIAARHTAHAATIRDVGAATLRRPVRVAAVLAAVVAASAPRNVARQLVAALIGVGWAGHLLRHGAGPGPARRPTLLHAHFGWVAATAAWAAGTVAEVPHSVVLHAFELHTRRRLDRFTPIPLRSATQVFTISLRDADEVERRWGLDAQVLRMGVPLAAVTAGEPIDRRDRHQIVAAGSLVDKKGHDVLIDALAQLDDPWRCTILGAGPLDVELADRASRLGISRRVELLGHVDEATVAASFATCGVAVLACRERTDGDRDGIPVALVEAMAAGAPVVSTDVGAIRELVDGVGILVEPDNASALAAAIERFADDDTWHRSHRAGLARVRREFVVDDAAAPVRDLIDLLAEPGPFAPGRPERLPAVSQPAPTRRGVSGQQS